MALTPSTMLELGTKAPDFSLKDTDGVTVSLKNFPKGQPLLVMFICNHCPYVKHICNGLSKLGKDYKSKNIQIIAVNSNDIENYPEDSPENMAAEKKTAGYVFPYLFDESQNVAKAYKAACTPDFFLFDGLLKLVYRGQFDPSRPGNGISVTGADLRKAMDEVLSGKSISVKQVPSIGCNIKWRK